MNASGVSIRPLIVLTGKFQEGKSTLINQLLGGKYARTGNGLSTTRCCVRYCYGESESVRVVSGDGVGRTTRTMPMAQLLSGEVGCGRGECIEVVCRNDLLRKLTLVDTPGFDACDDDDGIASRILSEASLVIYVHRGNALYSLPPPLRQLQRQGTKVLFLYNRDDDQSDRQVKAVCDTTAAVLGNRLQLCHEIMVINILNDRDGIDRLRQFLRNSTMADLKAFLANPSLELDRLLQTWRIRLCQIVASARVVIRKTLR